MVHGLHLSGFISASDNRFAKLVTHWMRKMDFVFVKDLSVRAISGVDAWKRPQVQPLLVSIFVNSSIKESGATDHLKQSLNYDVLSRGVTKDIESSRFKSLTHVAEQVANSVLNHGDEGLWARIHVRKPRSLLRAESAEVVIARKAQENGVIQVNNTRDTLKINGLRLVTTIGVNHIERLYKQNVHIDLTMYKPLNVSLDANHDEIYDFSKIAENVANHVEASSYKTIEAFASNVAHVVISMGITRVHVSAAKPSALTFAELAGVEITRTREDYPEDLPESSYKVPGTEGTETAQPLFPQTQFDPSKETHEVYLAFGSNLGDPVKNVRKAAELLGAHGVQVLRTSALYKSEPMYVKTQDKFVNGVFACKTTHSPEELLKVIKVIEYEDFERVKIIDNGPRPMDLDILLYDDVVLNSPNLTIPHIDMLNRSFVLQPLVDVVPPEVLHPLTAEPFTNHIEQLPKSTETQDSSDLTELVPFGPESTVEPGYLDVDPLGHSKPTLIMSVLNVTPDSFSDGGDATVNNIVDLALEHVKNGANILDIGGLSTRPGASEIPEEEELNRVIPAIKQLRADPRLKNIPISIDTYRSNVARSAIQAGANIINDVFAGQKDAGIFTVAKDLQVPLILSHARGDPQNMNSLTTYENGVVSGVASELAKVVDQALEAGVCRWQLILDPGLGFAKNLKQNVALIREFQALREKAEFKSLPWLVGPSRKGFIGTITGAEAPKDRVIGTSVSVTALIQSGADIVRVHDTAAINETVKMADAIFKNII